MTVSYNKLWKLCIDNEMRKSDLAKATSMSPSTLAKLGKNEPVSLETLMRICKVFHCDIGEIVEIKLDD
jgi:DNA-binding Xre family transcriptional regulator